MSSEKETIYLAKSTELMATTINTLLIVGSLKSHPEKYHDNVVLDVTNSVAKVPQYVSLLVDINLSQKV